MAHTVDKYLPQAVLDDDETRELTKMYEFNKSLKICLHRINKILYCKEYVRVTHIVYSERDVNVVKYGNGSSHAIHIKILDTI